MHSAAESESFCQNEACGEPIPEERRRAVSGCRFCVECQELREQVLNRRYACK
ncbi:TraR/DksA C4-type zinc finger protein [Burkholderia latens]|uniref:TraR/DksA C4-type zinc finger protein n=1 Tax=Burkholderia latens TaxID=488446 RepID=UPI001FC822A8|nr:TraR/DksA C4-type zinc finger protein [Burkholderia latens]